MTKTYQIPVEENEEGDAILNLPDEVLAEVGWREGDLLEWIDNKDGSFTLKKRETQFVLVETVQTFRHRYIVEVPTGIDKFGKPKALWALDTVTMEEAKEFSQEHLGETIVSHRVVSYDDVIELCDQDNDYVKDWPAEKKIEVFVTEWKDAD